METIIKAQSGEISAIASRQTEAFPFGNVARCVVCALPVTPAEFNVCKAHAGVSSAEFGAALKDNR